MRMSRPVYRYIPPQVHCMVCLERCGHDLCDFHTAELRRSRAQYEYMTEAKKHVREEDWARWLREESEWRAA